MSDNTAGAIGPLLTALRALPVWMLGGLALAGYAVLYVPAFGGVDLTGFRTRYGVYVWIEALTFSILALTRGLDTYATAHRAQRKAIEAGRALRLVPLHHQSWWNLARQQDDSFVSQFRIDIEVTNRTDRPVRIVKALLNKPKTQGEILYSDVSLPLTGSPYHSNRHPVPPNDTVTAHLDIMIRGALARQGKAIRVSLGVTDQFGDEYQLKDIMIRTHQPVLPKAPWKVRIASHLRKVPGLRSGAQPESLPAEWQHGGTFEDADLILNEERRVYAAHGRREGGLGSLNVGLQSAPPSLLWDKEHAKRIDSTNTARLIKLHSALDDAGRASLEQYLLTHLHRVRHMRMSPTSYSWDCTAWAEQLMLFRPRERA